MREFLLINALQVFDCNLIDNVRILASHEVLRFLCLSFGRNIFRSSALVLDRRSKALLRGYKHNLESKP